MMVKLRGDNMAMLSGCSDWSMIDKPLYQNNVGSFADHDIVPVDDDEYFENSFEHELAKRNTEDYISW